MDLFFVSRPMLRHKLINSRQAGAPNDNSKIYAIFLQVCMKSSKKIFSIRLYIYIYI